VEAGVKAQLNVLMGWLYTFWLAAPHLEEAVKAHRVQISHSGRAYRNCRLDMTACLLR